MKKFYVYIIFFFGIGSYSQNFEISGSLVDSISKEPLESATIFVTKIADTSLIAYTMSDGKGNFLLKGKSKFKKFKLNISYIGYRPYSEVIELNEENKINLDSIYLPARIESLDEVQIMGITPPIVFKNDTIEFSVDSFEIEEDAYLDEFLRLLPGFTVGENGNISFNGKPVDKVMVNGTRFFDDPKLATQNLSKDIIEKIQVLDTRSKSQVFTGEKASGKSKTINLQIAEENNKGLFGNINAKAGTKDRYQVNGMLNYFNDKQRASVIANSNNVLNSSHDYSNVVGYIGDGNASVGGGTSRSNSVMSNYSNSWGKFSEISNNYKFNDDTNLRELKKRSLNRLPDGRKFTNLLNQNSQTGQQGHFINPRFETTLDSTYLIQFVPNFRYSQNKSESSNNQQSFNELEELKNSSEVYSNSKNVNKDFNASLAVTRKYGKLGGMIQLNLQHGVKREESNLKNFSETNFYQNTSSGQTLDSTLVRDQVQEGLNKNFQQTYNILWKIPLSKRFFITPKYQYNSNRRKNQLFVYDQSIAETSTLNEEQSSDFKNTISEHRPSLETSFVKDKLTASLSLGSVYRKLESTEFFNDINFENHFSTLALSSSLSYRFSTATSLILVYNMDNSVPDVSQLSPYIDVSDPLYIVRGNPELEAATSHNFQLLINSMNFEKNYNFSINGYLSTTENAVTSKTEIGEDLVKETTFENVDGNYLMQLNGRFSKQVKIDSLKQLSLSLGSNFHLNSQINFINGSQYRSINQTFTPSVSISFNSGAKIRSVLTYAPRIGKNSFSKKTLEDTDFINQNISFSSHINWWKLKITNSLNYSVAQNISSGFNRKSLLWNSGLGFYIIDKKLRVTLDGYDILNQNLNSKRYSTGESVIDVESSIQRRYFMIGLSYMIKAGSKPQSSFSILGN